MTLAERLAAFTANAGRSFPAVRVDAVERAALSLDVLPVVATLMRACRG